MSDATTPALRRQLIQHLPELRDDDKLDEALRRIARQVAMEEIGKKPEVTVVVSRLMAE